MSNKFKPVLEAVREIKIKSAFFIRDIPIFLNYQNKISNDDFFLTIKGELLCVQNKKTQLWSLIPLFNVASMEPLE